MKTFDQIVAETAALITEIMPWDLAEKIDQPQNLLIIDVREADEYQAMHIANSINIPRGILESASEQGYDETDPELSLARDREVVVICRSGKRSCMAAHMLQQLGFNQVMSLKTGLRGWNDFDQDMVDDQANPVDGDDAESFLASKVE
jgi:rhodanese-related sulfurtransferase